ncbi:glycosyltransferase 61 family protein [Granulosicoccus sp. 3-233]|uniref:glycosyltransferase family 61 protein n=1 Tax=Granulosicoccus sp. 3-233 TaxID=3417969 RepID=UPI003D34B0EF
MRGKPALLLALNQLKTAAEEQQRLGDSAFDGCRKAPADVHYAHALYREIGEIALRQQLWETAEEFAIRTLKKMPSSGAALKILGKSLHGRNRLDEAALCHRYRLPSSVRDQYFSDKSLSTLHSTQSKNLNCLMAHEAESRPVSPPTSLHETSIHELSQTQLNSSAAYTFQLPDARLWFDGFNTAVWDKQGYLIADASRGLPDVVHCALDSRPAQCLSGRTCVLGNRNSGNYYHWMNDILPRLHVLQQSGIALESIDHFLINPLQHEFQKETLGQFGIDDSRLHFSKLDTFLHCDELFLPVFGSNTLGKAQAPWTPAFLKSAFLDKVANTHDDRLHISRKTATGRSIENEESLVAFLQTRGFRSVNLEGLAVRQQARLFNAAAVVIGAHGAGFTNCVFCEPGTTIIELYRDHIAPCYWLTSELTALRHAVHYCGADAELPSSGGSERYHASADRRRLSDFTVELDSLRKLLDLLHID